MFESIIANVIFQKLLGRPDISQAYKMVPKTDSWYDTIQKVHDSLAEIQTLPRQAGASLTYASILVPLLRHFVPTNPCFSALCTLIFDKSFSCYYSRFGI